MTAESRGCYHILSFFFGHLQDCDVVVTGGIVQVELGVFVDSRGEDEGRGCLAVVMLAQHHAERGTALQGHLVVAPVQAVGCSHHISLKTTSSKRLRLVTNVMFGKSKTTFQKDNMKFFYSDTLLRMVPPHMRHLPSLLHGCGEDDRRQNKRKEIYQSNSQV